MLVVRDWLKEYAGDSLPSAEEIEKLLTFHAFEIEGVETVEGEEVIDVDVLPNRSSDCLCHRGIAREIATLTGTPLVYDPLAEPVELASTDDITVTIEDPQACPRFTASLITGIEVKESPEWLKKRLTAIGQRPINNIVDATNYVMFAIGQPLHAYDADLFPQVDGKWQFGVRLAKEGEVVSLIAEGGKDEDRDVTLKGTELLIIDDSSNTPIGLAGVKGGRYAGVHEGTTKIIIEAAHFDPVLTRKTARGLGIVIDASKRFENEPSRELPPYGQKEIVDLILKIAGGTCEGMIDVYRERWEEKKVAVSATRTNALLGLSIESDEMKRILLQAGMTVGETDDGFMVAGPWERTDLAIEEDFIEEIGRVYGYQHVASIVPESVNLSEYNARQFYGDRVRDTLISLGFSEVITSSFRKKDEISLLNALASDKGCLRSSLHKNIADVLDKNAGFTDLFGTQDTRVFEIGTVFKKGEHGVEEHVSLCLGVRTKQSGHSKKDDEVLEAAIGELTISLDTNLSFDTKEGIAECNFTDLYSKLPAPTSYDALSLSAEINFTPFSVFPHMSRDIALWVSEGTDAATVEKVLNEHASDLRVRTTLFDEFSKDGKTSYAFRLVFQSNEKTLTDEEVNTIMDSVNTAASTEGWEVR